MKEKKRERKGKRIHIEIFLKSFTILPTRWPQKAPHLEATSS
jgi:hypothetical protein